MTETHIPSGMKRQSMATDREGLTLSYAAMEAARRSTPSSVNREDGKARAAIIRHVREVADDAEKHGNTAGLWLFADQWRTILAALSASPVAGGEVERLREALKPFVEAAQSIRPDDYDNDRPAIARVGDYRALLAALASPGDRA